ncbi:energy transducer TonB [Shewanella donghaensis]|uniref:energy transducer TonB n=1 Tax=Shewanella donghaensis TaxID=238836 RepID=UPI0011825183|nr:energy transducer TonB [Shewanella donghaensis]
MTPKRYFAFGCLTILIQGGVLASQNSVPEIQLTEGAAMGSNHTVSIAIAMQAKTAMVQQSKTKEVVEKEVKIQPEVVKQVIKKTISEQAIVKAKPKEAIEETAVEEMVIEEVAKTDNTSTEVNDAEVEQAEELTTSIESDNSHNQQQVDAKQGVSQQTIALNKPTFSAPPAQPNYPKKARKRGFEGTATIEVMFNQIGEQLSLTIIDSSGYNLLDAAAMNAVEQWQFAAPSPQTAYAYTVRVPVKFALN